MKLNPPAPHLQLPALLHRALCVFLLWALLLPFPLWANPEGGNVRAGNANICTGCGSFLEIVGVTDGTVIDWDSFDIEATETTQFLFLDVHGRVLNRDLSGDFSNIAGELIGRLDTGEGAGSVPVGQIFLVNPNGIVIDGLIDAGAFFGVAGDLNNLDSLIADPANWTELDADLTTGVGAYANRIENNGTIAHHPGGGELADYEAIPGNVVLLGRHVQNMGTIIADGTVALVAGDHAVLANLDSSITIQALSGGDPTPGAIGVDQQGDITGHGGIQLAASDMYALGVNTSGLLNSSGAIDISATAFAESDPILGSNSGIEMASAEIEDEGPCCIEEDPEVPAFIPLHLPEGVVAPIEGANITITGDVTLTGRTDIVTTGSTTFLGTIDGPHDLQVEAGTDGPGSIVVGGDIGSASPLASVLLETGGGSGYGEGGPISTQDITTGVEHIEIAAFDASVTTGDLTTSGGAVDLSGDDVSTGSIDSGAGNVVIDAANDIHVGDAFNPDGIPGTEPNGGSIDTATGNVVLTAGGDLTVGGTITSTEGGDIDLFASDDVHVGDAIETTTGAVDLVANEDVTVGASLTTGDSITTMTGNVTVTADADGVDDEGEGGGYVEIEGLIDTAGDNTDDGPVGYVTVTGESVTVGDIDTVGGATGGNVTLGAEAGVTAGAITTATGNVMITADADGDQEGNAFVSGTIDTAGNGPDVGSVSVTGENVTVADVNTVDEVTDTSSALTFTGNDVETGVLTTTDADINVDADNDAQVGGANTTTGNIVIMAGDDAHVGEPFNPDLGEEPMGDGSITTTSGDISIFAVDDVTVAGSITTTTGEVYLDASDDIHVGDSISNTTGDVILEASEDVTVGGSIATTTGDVHVHAFEEDATVEGSITTTTGDVEVLTGLGYVEVGNDVTVGGSIETTDGYVYVDAGNDATVDGSITTTTGEVEVFAGQDALVGGSIETTEGYVDVFGDTGDATVLGDITTTTGGVEVDANNATVGGSIETATGDVDIIGYTGDATVEGGIETTTGDVRVLADGDATVEGSIATTTGDVIVSTYGSYPLGEGLVEVAGNDAEVGGGVTTTTGQIQVVAVNDATVSGPITTGTGNVTVTANADGSEGGDAVVGGAIDTAGDGPEIGSVTVTGENVTVANVDTVDDVTGTSSDLTLNAPVNVATGVLTTAGGDIDIDAGNDATVGGTSMTTGNLDVYGGHDAIVTGPIATDGNVHVEGGNNAAVDGVTTTAGNVDVIGGNDASVTGPITTTSGNVTVDAGNDALVTGSIETTTGQVLVEADHDATVEGAVTTTAGNVTVTADADENLDGDARVEGAIDTAGNGPSIGSVNVTGVNVTVGDVDTVGAGTSSDLTLSGVDVVTGVLTTGSGDIDIDATHDATVGGTSMMTGNVAVDAENDVAIAGAIETEGNVHVEAGNNVAVESISSTTGNVDVIAGQNAAVSGEIGTTTGDVLLMAGNDAAVNSITTTGGSVTVDAGNDAAVGGPISTTSGSVDVLANNDASVSGGITTTGGSVTVTADRDGANGGDAAVDGRIETGGGNVEVSGQNVEVAGVDTSGGNLDLMATAPDGTLTLSGDLDAGNSGDVLLEAGDAVLLQGNTSVSGGVVDIASEVEGQGGANFTVEGNRITLRNDVTTGGSQTYEGSQIRVGADSGDYTSRNGSVTFDGDTVLEGDTNVSSSGSSSFNGTIDGRFDLEVDAGRNVNIGGDIGGRDRVGNLVLDGRDGVNIAGDIDASGNIDLLSQRGDIVFDADGRNSDTTVVAGGSIIAGSDLGSVPNRASIYAAPGSNSLTFDAGNDFTAGENQKIAANELAIFAGDTARVGDLSAIESIIVGADTVTFNQREPGPILTPGGSVIQETGSNLPDVVANQVTIEGRVTNPDDVTFSTATGTVQGGTDFPSVFPLDRELQARDLVSGDTVLDLAAIEQFGGPIDPTLQDQTPTIDFIGLVPLAAISVADVGRLRAAEVLAFLRCGLLEGGEDEDLPEYCLLPHVGEGPPGEESEQVAIPEELVGSEPALVAASIYRRLTDPDSGAGNAREALAPAFTGFESQSGSPIDGREFSRFVGTDTEYTAAAGYLDEAGFLFEQLEKIGLDEVEYQELRMMLLEEVSSMVGLASLSPQVLGASIEARR